MRLNKQQLKNLDYLAVLITFIEIAIGTFLLAGIIGLLVLFFLLFGMIGLIYAIIWEEKRNE